MNLKIDAESKEIIQKVHLLSGSTYEEIKTFFESFFIVTFLNYLEGKRTKVPYLGAFEFVYDGDEMTPEGRKAKISIKPEFDEMFVRVLGQLEDVKEGRAVSSDLEEILKRSLSRGLEQVASDSEKAPN